MVSKALQVHLFYAIKVQKNQGKKITGIGDTNLYFSKIKASGIKKKKDETKHNCEEPSGPL